MSKSQLPARIGSQTAPRGGADGRTRMAWAIAAVVVPIVAIAVCWRAQPQTSIRISQRPPVMATASPDDQGEPPPGPRRAMNPDQLIRRRREIKWEAAQPQLAEAGETAKAALDARIKAVEEFFAERKRGVGAFAGEVLSGDAKMELASDLASTAADAGATLVSRLFGGGAVGRPDADVRARFTEYVGRCFRRHVLDHRQLGDAVHAAVVGYRGDLQELEGPLLVAYGIDGGLPGFEPAPRAPVVGMVGQGLDDAIGRAAAVGSDDFGTAIFGVAGSMLAGNALGEALTPADATGLQRVGVDLAAGAAADAVIGKAIEQAGHGTAGRLAAETGAALDRIRTLVLEGEPIPTEHYRKLSDFAVNFYDAGGRKACSEALAAMDGGGRVGLRARLERLRADRARLLDQAVEKAVWGPTGKPGEPSASPQQVYYGKPMEMIDYARRCISCYGAKQP